MDKPLVWLEGELKTPPFSNAGRIEAGFLLRLLQQSKTLGLPQTRAMPVLGARCHELRINDASASWRIMYRVDADAFVTLEVFSKKPAQTSKTVTRCANKDSRNTTIGKSKKQRLESKGWRVGSTQDFLGLSDEESAYIELKARLAKGVRRRRQEARFSQAVFAQKLRSSQSRVAKIEAGDPSVSLDLLIRSLISLGLTARELSKIIAAPRAA